MKEYAYIRKRIYQRKKDIRVYLVDIGSLYLSIIARLTIHKTLSARKFLNRIQRDEEIFEIYDFQHSVVH